MKYIRLLPVLLLSLLAFGCAGAAVSEEATPAPTATPTETPPIVVFDKTPTPSPTPTPEPTPSPSDVLGERVRDNLLVDQDTLTLVSFSSEINLYVSPSTESERSKLVNYTTDRIVSELIVLGESTDESGYLFYKVRAAFSDKTGYVLASKTGKSRLAESSVSGFALMQCPGCTIFKSPNEESAVLAQESYHAARVLGEYKDYYYVLTEDGNAGYVLPAQLKMIDAATLEAYLASGLVPYTADAFSLENVISYAEAQTEATSSEALIYDALKQQGLYFSPGYYQFFQKDLFDLTKYPIGYQADVYNSSLFKLWNSAGNLVYYEDQPTQWEYIPATGSLERGDLLFFAEYGAADTAVVETYEIVLRGPDSGYITACGIYLGNDRMLWVNQGRVETVDALSSAPIWQYFDSARRIHSEVTDLKTYLIECVIASGYDRLGTPYHNIQRMGEDSYDCSGFVGWTFRRAGISQLRGSRQFRETTASGLGHLEKLYYGDYTLQLAYVSSTFGNAEDVALLERGDLVFLLGESHARISHIMIYLGDMRVIHSTTVTDFYRGTLVAGFREELQGLYTNALRIVSIK